MLSSTKMKGKTFYTENEVKWIVEFLIDNTFEFWEHIFNTSLAYLWEQTVSLSLELFFYTLMRLSLYKYLNKRNKILNLDPLISLSSLLMMFCQLIIQTW